MKIRRLELAAFGKFHQKTVEFADGINWIHGENESGKSTIHKFIEGMLFGFFKESASRRVYSEDYERYLPLGGRDYFGAMVVEKNGQSFRLERNFLKGKDSLRIYDQITGEDKTDLFPFDPGLRMAVFFAPDVMNRSMFRNSLSTGQMKVRTDEELAEELQERILRFSSTGSNLSLTGALDELKKKRWDIGSKTRKSSPMGQRLERMEELKKLQIGATQNREQLLGWAQEKEALKEQTLQLEKERKDLTGRLENMEVKKVHEKYRAYEKLKSEADQWQEYILEQPGPFLTEEEYGNALALHQDRVRLEEELYRLQEELSGIRSQLDGAQSTIELDQDRRNWEEAEKILEDSEAQSKEPSRKRRPGMLLFPVFSGALVVICALLGILYENLYLLASAGIFVGATIYGILRFIGKGPSGRGAGEETEHGYVYEKARQEMDALLKKYAVSSPEEMKSLWDEEQNRRQVCENQFNDMTETWNQERNSLDKIRQESAAMLQHWQVKDMQDLLHLYQSQKKQRRAGERIRELKATMEALMSEDEFERFHLFFTGKGSIGAAREDGEALKSRLDILEETIPPLKERMHRLEGQMLSLERDGLDPADLEEELDWLENQNLKDMQRLEALSVAEKKIETAAKDLHREVAPRLREHMEGYWSHITGSNRELKVDQTSNIRVAHEETSAMVGADYLSMGATDQLYLAFRLSIVRTLGLDGYPLLLDEVFTQFDDRRLERAVALISEERQKRQILMFTSQNREKESMEKLGVPYHPVLL